MATTRHDLPWSAWAVNAIFRRRCSGRSTEPDHLPNPKTRCKRVESRRGAAGRMPVVMLWAFERGLIRSDGTVGHDGLVEGRPAEIGSVGERAAQVGLRQIGAPENGPGKVGVRESGL